MTSEANSCVIVSTVEILALFTALAYKVYTEPDQFVFIQILIIKWNNILVAED